MTRTYQVVFADGTVAHIPANDCGSIGAFICLIDEKHRAIAAYPAMNVKSVELLTEPGLVLVKKP